MGLFDFIKKLGTIGNTSESKEQTSVFKGDLVDINEIGTEEKPKAVHDNPVSAEWGIDNKDSSDSIVFMTFVPPQKVCWVCSECGTINEDGLDGCAVCGLKK